MTLISRDPQLDPRLKKASRAAERSGLDPDGAIAAAYSPAMISRIAEIRAEAERAGVRGVPSVLTPDGKTHWGMGGLKRLLEGQPLIPRPV